MEIILTTQKKSDRIKRGKVPFSSLSNSNNKFVTLPDSTKYQEQRSNLFSHFFFSFGKIRTTRSCRVENKEIPNGWKGEKGERDKFLSESSIAKSKHAQIGYIVIVL